MATPGPPAASDVHVRKLERAREKFMQLLNIDRESPAFERLYAEVDGLLTSLLEDAEATDRDGEGGSSSPVALTRPRQM